MSGFLKRMRESVRRRRWSLCLFAAVMCALSSAVSAALARSGSRVAVPPLPVSSFVDTEVSTNVPISICRDNVRGFNLKIDFTASVSNAFTVAFGRDADGDGVLSLDETGLVVGWRGGRCTVEDVAGWVRLEESVSTPIAADVLSLRVETDGDGVQRRFAADCGGAAVFTGLAASPPAWLFDPGWDLVRVTRRGPTAAPSGWARIEIDHRGLVLRIR